MVVFDNLQDKLEEIRTNSFYKPLLDDIKKCYDAETEQGVPVLSWKRFNIYFENGSRKEYEDDYFCRRTRLDFAVILYLVYNEQSYLDEICDLIWQICGEISWVLPAHLNANPMNKYRAQIDLFAAETGQMLAEIWSLIGDKLPDKIGQLMRNEVKERIFDAYENGSFWWERLKSNWAAVCAGSVGMAYMYLAPERFPSVQDRIIQTMNSFLSGYGEDGCCTEGLSYWQYGFWFYLNFADMLYRFTEGEVDMLHGKKISNIALLQQNMILRKGITVSFSDGSMDRSFSNIGLYSFLKHNYEGYIMPSFYHMSAGDRTKFSWLIRNLLWSVPEDYRSESGVVDCKAMKYYENAQWYIVRREKYSFAAKVGHNQEEHNHNDIGSFIFADDSNQLLADIGAMEYTKANFAPETRYSLLQNSSLGHSVPIIDGEGQRYGKEYHGTVLVVSEQEFTMEIQDAYDTDIRKITRSFQMCDNGIIMCDIFDDDKLAEHCITERFVSVVKPELTEAGIRIGNAIVKAGGFTRITEEIIKDHAAQDFAVYLIDYSVSTHKFVMSVELI